MEKIVTKPLKIDFHIHSYFSRLKDDLSLVKEGKLENLHILLRQLKNNQIDMCAITDHDYFSYELYTELKSHENNCGKLKKVFPGVEFSVGIKSDNGEQKPIHVICVFDDENNEKVKKISQCIPMKDGKIFYDNENREYFNEEKFISILRDIDLNVITIAHQKQSVCSKNTKKNDVSTLGEVKFNELITCEYFESFEFKNMKNGMFNINYAIEKNKEYDQIRFITGSDCHDWNVYPKHDPKEPDDVGFKFTYLKCLPCFRGLAMSFSDTRRISTNGHLFDQQQKRVDNIVISIDNVKYDIPLSPGINVIIGDNSIGKSLLLHKMTDYDYLTMDSSTKIKSGYENYLIKNNIEISTKINKTYIHTFDYQGSIRDKFSRDNQDNSDFLSEKFPPDLDPDFYKTIINSEFEKLFECLKTKFQFDDCYRKLNSLTMVGEDVLPRNITAKLMKNSKTSFESKKKLMTYYRNIIAKIDSNFKLITDSEEKRVITEFRKKLVVFQEKYEKLYEKEKRCYELRSSINEGLNKFNKYVMSWKTDLENIKNKFDVEDSNTLANTISQLIRLKQDVKHFRFDVKETNIKPETLQLGDYIFVKKFNNCFSINNQYLYSVLKRVLKSGVELDSSKITQIELKNSILNYGDSNSPVFDVLKAKINGVIDDDLKSVPVITLKDQDVFSKLSSGMNSSIYFNILSGDSREGIYIVDQPEDDISQSSIKSNVLNDFKIMSNKRQLIMITHNPQFVVNLDVDNVICLTKKKGKLQIESGALEYTDRIHNVDILNTVAQSLDGGIESIRKRWKRYEKAVDFKKR